jgi:GAF domain-containing protein
MSDAIGELPDAEEPADRRPLESVDGAQLYAQYRRLVAEQAALRRLATLVARGVEPSEVFDAVTNEMCRCVGAMTAGLWRYDTTGEITVLSGAYLPDAPMKWPVGTRTPIEGNTLAAVVQRTGRPARMDTYDNATGTLAERVRAVGVRAAVGVPVIVDGRVWGLAAVGSVQPGPMPADTEVRLGRFAELIATAVVAGYRDEQKRQLLDEGSRRSSLVDALLEG